MIYTFKKKSWILFLCMNSLLKCNENIFFFFWQVVMGNVKWIFIINKVCKRSSGKENVLQTIFLWVAECSFFFLGGGALFVQLRKFKVRHLFWLNYFFFSFFLLRLVVSSSIFGELDNPIFTRQGCTNNFGDFAGIDAYSVTLL